MTKKRKWAKLTRPKFEAALVLIADGRTVSGAAHAVGCAPSTLRQWLLETYPEEYEEALERYRDTLRTVEREVAVNPDHKNWRQAHHNVSMILRPEYRAAVATQHVELSGRHGDAIQVEGRTKVGEVIDLLQALGAFEGRGHTRPALPDVSGATEVRPAGDLPEDE